MNRVIFAVLLLLPLFADHAAAAAGHPLRNFLQDLHTLSADFEQVVSAGEQSEAQFASGRLLILRPGRFRWEYSQPYEQTIIADGSRVWVIDPDLEQAAFRGQEAALKGTPARLLTGEGSLESDFTVTDLPAAVEGLEQVALRPHDPESDFKRILFIFRDDRLQAMEMEDGFGQTTRFQFHNVQRNARIDEALFRFEPPSGYDLISD